MTLNANGFRQFKHWRLIALTIGAIIVGAIGIGWRAGILFSEAEGKGQTIDSLTIAVKGWETWRVSHAHESDSIVGYFDRRDKEIEGRLDTMARDIEFIKCVAKAPYERRAGIVHCY